MLKDDLRRLREEAGLSQQELAERLHVVRQTVSKWERGLSSPDAGALRDLAALYGVSADELLGLTPEPAEEPAAAPDRAGRPTALARALPWVAVVGILALAFALLMIRGCGLASAPRANPLYDVVEFSLDGRHLVLQMDLKPDDPAVARSCGGSPEALEILAAAGMTGPDGLPAAGAGRRAGAGLGDADAFREDAERVIESAGGQILSVTRFGPDGEVSRDVRAYPRRDAT